MVINNFGFRFSNLKSTLFIIALSVLLFACERTIDFEIPDTGRKLTVECMLKDGEGVWVNLKHSKHVLDTSGLWENVKNANITIFKNGSLFEELFEFDNSGVYRAVNKVKNGNSYKIIIRTELYGETTAETYIPRVTEITNFELESKESDTSDRFNFNLNFNDDEKEDNFYLIRLSLKSFQRFYNLTLNKYELHLRNSWSLNIDYTYPDIDKLGYKEYNTMVFMDNSVNGQNFNFRISTFIEATQEPFEKDLEHYYIVYLHSISSDYYEYLISTRNYYYNKENYFSEPVQVYGNIENGLGIFAGYSTTVDSIKVE